MAVTYRHVVHSAHPCHRFQSRVVLPTSPFLKDRMQSFGSEVNQPQAQASADAGRTAVSEKGSVQANSAVNNSCIED